MTFDETNENVKNYVFARDKLLLIANEEVIATMMKYENEGVGKGVDVHDQYLTELVKAIRADLKMHDKHFPRVYMKPGSDLTLSINRKGALRKRTFFITTHTQLKARLI